jgi:DNA polymerase III epsilon subunit-like protein
MRSPRTAAIEWARSVVADSSVVYIDTETTGLDPASGAEIIDIAILSAHGSVLFNSLVRPVRPIPVESARIHGISDDHVVDAPAWRDIAPWVSMLLAGSRVIVYNAAFDSKMINGVCQRDGLDVIARDWECAMLQYAAFIQEPGRFGGFKWHRLETAAAAFGIQPGGHRALEDAVACRIVVHAMATTHPDEID